MAQNYFPSFTFPSSLEHTPSFSTGIALSLHLGRAGQGREGLLPHFFFTCHHRAQEITLHLSSLK